MSIIFLDRAVDQNFALTHHPIRKVQKHPLTPLPSQECLRRSDESSDRKSRRIQKQKSRGHGNADGITMRSDFSGWYIDWRFVIYDDLHNLLQKWRIVPRRTTKICGCAGISCMNLESKLYSFLFLFIYILCKSKAER